MLDSHPKPCREQKLADKPECENGSEDLSLTPRAHPLEDDLLESIEALSISPSPTEDYVDVADFFPDVNGGGGSSPESSVGDDYAEAKSYSLTSKEKGQRSKAFENPTMCGESFVRSIPTVSLLTFDEQHT